MRNFMFAFRERKEGVILLGSHIDTITPCGKPAYSGANDGLPSTGLLLAMPTGCAQKARRVQRWLGISRRRRGRRALDETDSIYGSRHLAARWQKDGTNERSGFLLAV